MALALWALGGCGGSDSGGEARQDAGSNDAASSDILLDVSGLDLIFDVVIRKDGEETPDIAPDIPAGLDIPIPRDGEEVVEGGFGWPCEENADCLADFCVEIPSTGESVCTVPCTEYCPGDWECRLVTTTYPDVVSVCVPPAEHLCEPCQRDRDCRNPADLCLAIGEGDGAGTYCGKGCGQTGSCPAGYTCTDIEEDGAVVARQCLPDTGSCICTAELDGTTQSCEIANEHGTCYGRETCDGPRGWVDCTAVEPGAELCDDTDNDCDGETDETFGYVDFDDADRAVGDACGRGICAGMVVCADTATATCDGLGNATTETCNALDDNCDGATDETHDCPGDQCSGAGEDYVFTAAKTCEEGDCTGPEPAGCGLYTCAGGGAEGDVCATSCSDDTTCVASAHCDETTNSCRPDLPPGNGCQEDTDCESDHCENGFCCATGDCCSTAADCPESYWVAPTCDDATTCQGHRVDAVCEAFLCAQGDPIGDDRGCDGDVLALDCTPAVPVFCAGTAEQDSPVCPATCADDAGCVEGYHCDGTCVADEENGAACDEPSDCISGHCQNGFCCAEGDCCQQAEQCPGDYSAGPDCTDTAACQGERVDALCTDNICGSTEAIDDDTGCTETTVADECEAYLAVTCTGEVEQTAPACPESCVADEECDEDAHCDDVCTPDVDDGDPCDEDSDCASGYCSNGFCCTAGDCCDVAGSCPETYTTAPVCENTASCQGYRVDPTCSGSVCGTTARLDDDSACGIDDLALVCEPYAPVYCTGATEQDPPSCGSTCGGDEDCSANAHCDDGSCVFDGDDGDPCDEPSDCTSGHCQNGFCCTGGDCCQTAGQCPSETYSAAATCDTTTTCQGHRVDATCVANVCGSTEEGDDSACGPETLARPCGLYLPIYCTGAEDQLAPECPESCGGDEDCDENAHCDGVCTEDLPDGAVCDEPSDCVSGHCQNGFCCTGGDCCQTAGNCPASYSDDPTCDFPTTCQGHRVDATCTANQCGSQDTDDDSACDGSSPADDCGLYPAVYCTGEQDQNAPPCTESCLVDEECDGNAHCDGGLCLEDQPDGTGCDEPSDCISGHCQNNFCCASGDCCDESGDCPGTYSAVPICDTATTCQGHRVDAQCIGSICQSADTDDDSACDAGTLARPCGFYLPIYCTGQATQTAPDCPESCTGDEDCDENAHCDAVCTADLEDGAVCDEPSDCISGHCQNGFCCTGGDCCADAGSCPAAYSADPVCDNSTTCQGHRVDATCVDSVCGSADADDDTACDAGVLADACGFFPDLYCTGDAVQSTPTCSDTCSSDTDCDGNAHCDGGSCFEDVINGESCNEHSDCVSGHCQNGFCCGGGDCCNVAGSCPAFYSALPVCDSSTSCQGHRVDATCIDSVCGSANADDDSACYAGLLANACGFYQDLTCTGAVVQPTPTCPNSCTTDPECDANAHCDDTCVADLGDGGLCDENSDCISDHCQNDRCCASGDCCLNASECPGTYSALPTCDNEVTCQGHRVDATCSSNICGSSAQDDDTACTITTLANDCGLFLDIFCNGQLAQVSPSCDLNCADDFECDANAHCDGGACVGDVPDGGSCDEASDCVSGYCQGGICCGSGECCATPTATETRVCGDCGSQDRACGSNYIWGSWSVCTGQGCHPGDTRDCNNCGTQSCTASCTWGTCNIGPVDGYEQNDTEATAYVLPTINDDDGNHTYVSAQVNPAYDEDWFRVRINDDAGYTMGVFAKLTVPGGETYRLCAYWRCFSGAEGSGDSGCITVGGGLSGQVDLDAGTCCNSNCGWPWEDNAGNLVIRVDPVSTGVCTPEYRVDYGG